MYLLPGFGADLKIVLPQDRSIYVEVYVRNISSISALLLTWEGTPRKGKSSFYSCYSTFQQDDSDEDSLLNACFRVLILYLLALLQGRTTTLCFKFEHRFDLNLLDVLVESSRRSRDLEIYSRTGRDPVVTENQNFCI
mmetsp:Transcript_13041/g.19300  ORF Transcript_13041/g.19300 Transcript_13041/m.19300 type:complete len:138 (+) Transcript_13041:2724-3137(+)